MRITRSVWYCLLALAAATPTAAFGQVLLKPNYAKAASYQEAERVEIKQQLSIAGQDVDTAIDTKVVTKVSVAPGQEGAKVTNEVQRLQANITTPVGEVSFDSEKPDEAPDNPLLGPVIEQFKSAASAKFSYQVSPDLKVSNVQGAPGDSGPAAIQKQIQTSLDIWPDKPVKEGDSWEREVSQSLGQGQALVFKRRYTYLGHEFRSTVSSTRRLEKIKAEDLEVKLTIDPTGGIPGSVEKSDLKVTSTDRMILFDAQLGRSIEAMGKVNIQGDITLNIMNQELPGTLDLQMNLSQKEIE